MKRLAAITLLGLLAGCTGTELLPLQRDLQRFDAFVKERSTGQHQTTAAVTEPAAPQDTAPVTAQPEVATATAEQPAPVVQQPAKTAPNFFERLRQNRAKGDATVAAPPPETATAAVEPAPVAPQSAKPAPNLFERLRQNRAAQAGPAMPPGPHDQIPEPIPVDNPLVRPPWEVFMEAGPNANEELDLETLYGPGKIPPELQTADAAANPDQRVAVTTPDLPAEAEQPAPDQPAPKSTCKGRQTWRRGDQGRRRSRRGGSAR